MQVEEVFLLSPLFLLKLSVLKQKIEIEDYECLMSVYLSITFIYQRVDQDVCSKCDADSLLRAEWSLLVREALSDANGVDLINKKTIVAHLLTEKYVWTGVRDLKSVYEYAKIPSQNFSSHRVYFRFIFHCVLKIQKRFLTLRAAHAQCACSTLLSYASARLSQVK